ARGLEIVGGARRVRHAPRRLDASDPLRQELQRAGALHAQVGNRAASREFEQLERGAIKAVGPREQTGLRQREPALAEEPSTQGLAQLEAGGEGVAALLE